MNLGLADKVAIVAAASDGLGKATALSLAEEGVNVVICARGVEKLMKTAEEIRSRTSSTVIPVQADVTKYSDIKSLFERTLNEFQRLDIVVTNAGGPRLGRFMDLTDEDWQYAFNQNFMNVVRMCREAIPHMKKVEGGCIVNIASVSVKQPIDNLILSNSIRLAVIGLAKTLANELGRYNIRVVNVCPGAIFTSRICQVIEGDAQTRGISYDHALNERTATIPMGRIGEPHDIGDFITFLVSERASYITGVTVQVNGGAVRFVL